MQKPSPKLVYVTAFTLSFIVTFAAGIFILHPQNVAASLITSLIVACLVVLLELTTRNIAFLIRLAGHIEQLATNPPANKKDRAKKTALITLFFIGFTAGNALLLDIATGGSDPRILTASPIVGAIYTYVFIKILRKKRKHFNK